MACQHVWCETQFDLGLEVRLEPVRFEARREGVGESDGSATFTGGVVTNATKPRMWRSRDPESGGTVL